MKYQTAKSMIAALALTAVSGCLSTAPGGQGRGEVAAAYKPVDGMSYEAASQLGIVEGQSKRFAFTNGTGENQNIGRTGGSITFVDGNQQENGDPDHDQAVIRTFDVTGHDGKTHTQITRTRYNEFYDLKDRALSVRNVDVGGQRMVRAQIYSRHPQTGETLKNNDFLYIPGSGKNARVGMTGQLDHGNTDVGIFGDRTTSSQMAATTGSATYNGVAHGYATNAGNFIKNDDGEYVGKVNMNVNFANGAYDSSSTMKHVGGNNSVSFEHSGTINSNGGMRTNRATVNGKDARDATIRGGMFGENAQSAGYAFDIVGEVGTAGGHVSPLTLTGGAILN